MFEFLRNMWVMKKIDEIYINNMVIKGRITEEEKIMILNTPR